MPKKWLDLIAVFLAFVSLSRSPIAAADWPQFMRSATHTGEAPEEALRLRLHGTDESVSLAGTVDEAKRLPYAQVV